MSVTAVNLSTRHFRLLPTTIADQPAVSPFIVLTSYLLPPTRYYMYVPAIVILRLFLILYLVHLFTGTVGSNNRF